MKSRTQTVVESFFELLASTFDLDRDNLALIAELRNGGPTVQPGPASKNQIEKVAIYGEDSFPSLWYDSLGSKHVEFRVVEQQKTETATIPRPLYSWQHHVMPGNCRICVNRWVQTHGHNEWPAEILDAGLDLRAAFARNEASCSVLVVTTGKSFSGAEPMSRYEEVFKGNGRGIYVLDLKAAA